MKQRRVNLTLTILPVLAVVSALVVIRPTQGKEALNFEAMIRQMLGGRRQQVQIPPLSGTYNPFSMEKAYHIQAALAEGAARTSGPVCGYKVAYASKAAQEQFGMDEPVRGPFYLSQRVPGGSALSAKGFNEIMLETEVAFTIGKRIDKPIKDVAALKRYVKFVHPAFDAGNYPYTAGATKPTPQDMVAIGTGAHVFVLGPAMDPDEVDIDAIDLALVRNGETIRKSPSRNVMGSPWNSLLWCANNLVKFKKTLEPGMVVLCGTASPAYRVKGDEIKGVYEADCGALGKVTLTID